MNISEGSPSPLGFTLEGNRGNFAVVSHLNRGLILGIFIGENSHPEIEVPLNCTNSVWHIAIENLPENGMYAYRFDDSQEWLIDPYAKSPLTRKDWGERKEMPLLAHLVPEIPFDWEGIERPQIPKKDLIIYEMHVRGFTKDPSSRVSSPGTFQGIIEKIPYFKELGINAVELMPVYEFDETYLKTGQSLVNYWGYSPLHFFAPMRRFAKDAERWGPIYEFKKMVKELHRNRIELILDVVYNHTGEDDQHFVHMRKLDPHSYYMKDLEGRDKNYSGCGNTVNTNHPTTSRLILDSLRYWASEMRVDGFRFDLASIFTRDQEGKPHPPTLILNAMKKDPLLKKCKLIAEPWDAAGLYQVGKFPHWGKWSEWNGKYRDIVRRFIKGTDGQVGAFASALTGSELIYGYSKIPQSSVNFITSHDGFTLRDLVTYQDKHNEANGEENRDGNNYNDSWNCGHEGVTEDPKIIELREKQIRNFLLTLFVSQGIPMLLMGDEYGHSREGNNNAYVQDNPLNWFLWEELEKGRSIFNFTKALIDFRKRHLPVYGRFLSENDIEWHGKDPNKPNWKNNIRFIAMTLKGKSDFYLAFNTDFHKTKIKLPANQKWKEVVRTDKKWEDHFLFEPEKAKELPMEIELTPRTILIAIGSN